MHFAHGFLVHVCKDVVTGDVTGPVGPLLGHSGDVYAPLLHRHDGLHDAEGTVHHHDAAAARQLVSHAQDEAGGLAVVGLLKGGLAQLRRPTLALHKLHLEQDARLRVADGVVLVADRVGLAGDVHVARGAAVVEDHHGLIKTDSMRWSENRTHVAVEVLNQLADVVERVAEGRRRCGRQAEGVGDGAKRRRLMTVATAGFGYKSLVPAVHKSCRGPA